MTNNYAFIIGGDEFQWSFSRIRCYEDCKYSFFLKYLYHGSDTPQFFAQYGSFMHDLHRRIYCKELMPDDVVGTYLTQFSMYVNAPPPNANIFSNYFNGGLNYWRQFVDDTTNVIEVEKKHEWDIGNKHFIGFVDLLDRADDGTLILTDHKSRTLAQPSGRKKPTANDKLVDEYFKQLYIYCKPIYEEYGEFPGVLRLNCFRTPTVIERKFDNEQFKKELDWASHTIERITDERYWAPDIDEWRCRHLCSMRDECDYFKQNT